MRLFLLVFFLIYGSFHVYLFLKARAAFNFGVRTGVLLTIFMLFMIMAPVIVRLSENAGQESFARLLSYLGYFWFAFIFLFISSSLVTDLYRSVVSLSGFVTGKNIAAFQISPLTAFFIPAILSISISVYGYFEALNLRTEKIEIKSPKLPADIKKLRIVQISDVHLGLIVGEQRLKLILRRVKDADPDILVSTGDLVDGQIADLHRLSGLFQEIKPRFGKFAVTGNHEFYAGISQSIDFTKKAGFRVLRGEGISADGVINIAGVDDETGKYFKQTKKISERALLSSLPEKNFTLLLKHRPVVDKNSAGLFDLQLSGHTHKGQIFPFSIITSLYYPVHAGCLNPADGCYLYVSRGTGTWGPPVRFLSPPEITVIDIVRGDTT